MGKPKKPKLPPAPTAEQILSQQAQANRIDQTTPFGSVTYSGPYRQNLSMSLSPQFQSLLDAQTGFGTQAAQAGSQFLNAANLTPVELQDTTAVGQSMFDLGLSRAAPWMDQRRSRLTEQLAQSGNPSVGADLAPGAVSELDLLGRQENQFLSDLALQSIIGATQQRGQLLGQDLGVQEGNARIAAMLGGASPVGVPGLQSFYGPQGLDAVGANQASYNAAAQRAQLQQQQRSGFFGGLFDLGMAGLGLWNGGAFSGLAGGGGSPLMSSLGRYGVF